MSSLVSFLASSNRMPLSISVSTEEEAMAEAQPKVLNLASVITWFSSTLMLSRRASPQAMEPTLPTPSAPSISPTFLGLMKWSCTFSV